MPRQNHTTNNIEFSHFNQLINSLLYKHNLEEFIQELVKQLTSKLKAKRATFYFYNEEVQELWSYVAKDLEIREIRIPLGQGVAGICAQKKEIINIENATTCPFFNEAIDKKTGFITKTILAAPLINKNNKLIAVIQIINKNDGTFTKSDEIFLQMLSHYAVVAVENIFLLQEQETLMRSTLYALASAIDAKDPITAGHSHRVAYYSVKIGHALKLTEAEIKLLEYAAYLHDVGKIGVEEAILNKKGRLTDEEFAVIRKHPTHTLQILKQIIFPEGQKDIPAIAAAHHEYIDGSGYPFKLKGGEISLYSRIITLADIFDALTAFDRPYKKHLNIPKAIKILREETAKNHLDAKIVDLFINKKLYTYERRQYKRLDYHLTLKYHMIPQRKILKQQINDEQKKTAVDLHFEKPTIKQTEDISLGGLLFLTKQYLSVGTYLELDIKLLDFQLKCIGKIVWIEKIVGTLNYKAGVCFINMSLPLRDKLDAALKELQKQKNS